MRTSAASANLNIATRDSSPTLQAYSAEAAAKAGSYGDGALKRPRICTRLIFSNTAATSLLAGLATDHAINL
ncbi:MAG: hypothetical protein MUO33_12415 [Sedimentisphaerales bacterium]|nr:hypothetical protein [Sedimentisphaerales bacterium]